MPGSTRVNDRAVEVWAQCTASSAKSTPTTIWATSLPRLLRPRLRLCRYLDPVVEEPDQAEQEHGDDDQRSRCAENRPSGPTWPMDVAETHGGHDGDATHGRRAGLGAVGGRAVLADVLADPVAGAATHQERRGQDRDEQGDPARLHERQHRSAHRATATGRPPLGDDLAVVERPPLVAVCSWTVSWPLPATTHHVAAAGRRPSAARWPGPAVGLDDAAVGRDRWLAGAIRPPRTSSMIGRGSSCRGLSDVRTATVGQSRRHLAHQRPLGPVAVAAAAEHDQHPGHPPASAAGLGQHDLEAGRRVGVVDEDRERRRQSPDRSTGRRRPRAGPGPTGAWPSPRRRVDRSTPRATAASAASSALSTLHRAGHRELDPLPAPDERRARPDRRASTCGAPMSARTATHRDPGLGQQPRPHRVVGVDDAPDGPVRGEQRRLGREVRLHRPVEVEVVVAEVGEDGHVEVDAVHPRTAPARGWRPPWPPPACSVRRSRRRAPRPASAGARSPPASSGPRTASRAPSPADPDAPSTAPSRWATVVLPLVPVIPAISRSRDGCPRTRRPAGPWPGGPARAPPGPGPPTVGRGRTCSQSRPTAPRPTASAAYRCPSVQLPGQAAEEVARPDPSAVVLDAGDLDVGRVAPPSRRTSISSSNERHLHGRRCGGRAGTGHGPSVRYPSRAGRWYRSPGSRDVLCLRRGRCPRRGRRRRSARVWSGCRSGAGHSS